MEYELTAIALLAMIILLLMGIRLGINTIIYFKFGSREILATHLQLQRMAVLVIVRVRSPTARRVNLRVAAVILSPVRVRVASLR